MQLVALDIGYGFVKVATAKGRIAFHSVMGPGSAMPSFGMQVQDRSKADSMAVEIDGQAYFVGKMAIRRSKAPVRPLSRDRFGGVAAQVLALGALALLREMELLSGDDAPVTLVSGAPPGWMHQGSSLERALVGQHEFVSRIAGRARHHQVTVRDVLVLPQALGAYWHHVTAVGSDEARMLSGRVGVIDIGFRTVDLASIIEGEYIPEASHTLEFGFSKVAEELSRIILDLHGLSIPPYALDDALISGSVRVGGQEVSIERERDALVNDLALQIVVELESRWQALEFDLFLLAGGAASLLQPALDAQLNRCQVASHSASANVLGYLQYGNQLLPTAATAAEVPVADP